MSDASARIMSLVTAAGPAVVWVPTDFAHLGSRDVIDKTLQRLVTSGNLRRIDRGLYDLPAVNRLTRRSTVPDYRAVIDALARRDQLRLLVDGMTAANDLGLTDAVPARVTIHTDARRRSIQLDNLLIDFKQTAPSRLYWAGRPAMRVVQALHWLKDTLSGDADRIRHRLHNVLTDPKHGPAIIKDLIQGFSHLPIWMQTFLRTVPGFNPSVEDTDIPRPSKNLAETCSSPLKSHPARGSR
ncbi:Transcriptional regulator, AbiEi antitoxin, Type IV TA system [Burkholderia sp. GAS332]|nr:Transcriptional regulator, AbiEi antitoxin, Type IV TA system [Burkholderia sp. GAS332]